MSGMSWDTVLSVSSGRWAVAPTGDQPPPVGVAIDTRELHRGQTFVAYVGQRVDGHAYLDQARDLRAAMCIVTDATKIPEGFDVPTLVVDDATDALTAMAMHWRSQMQGTVIGVTGSNGKTTTTRLIHAVLNNGGKAWVSSKSHNNAIGVPMSVLNAPLDAEHAIFELGTSSPGEIAQRAQLVLPDIGVITSIGRAHLEELGSIEGVCSEKASMLGHVKNHAIVPDGVLDEAIRLLAPGCTIERVGQQHLSSIKIDERSVSFEFGGHPFTVPVPGVHNASNAAMAVLVGRACGMDDPNIAAGLLSARLPEMRLSRIEIPTKSDPIVIYNDAYNANPDSTRAALTFFEGLRTDANKVVVLGDMLELGSAGEREHDLLIDDLEGITLGGGRIVLVGPMYAKAVLGGGDRFESYPVTDDHAMTEIARTINLGDVVLIKGSRGVGLERLVYILINRHTPYAKSGQSQSPEGTNTQ